MSAFFSPDSKLYQVLTAISTLVLANLAFIALLLPVVSGGVGLLLVFSVGLNYFREGTVNWKKAWRTCQRGWLPATGWWLFNVCFGLLAAWEWLVLNRLTIGQVRILGGAWLILATYLVGMINVWIWPQLVKLTESAGAGSKPESFSRLFVRAIRLGFLRMGRTLGALMVVAAPVILAVFSDAAFWPVVGWMAILGFSFGAYLVILLVGSPLGFTPAADDEDKFSF